MLPSRAPSHFVQMALQQKTEAVRRIPPSGGAAETVPALLSRYSLTILKLRFRKHRLLQLGSSAKVSIFSHWLVECHSASVPKPARCPFHCTP